MDFITVTVPILMRIVWIMSLMVLLLPNYNVKSLLLVWFKHRNKVYNMLINMSYKLKTIYTVMSE